MLYPKLQFADSLLEDEVHLFLNSFLEAFDPKVEEAEAHFYYIKGAVAKGPFKRVDDVLKALEIAFDEIPMTEKNEKKLFELGSQIMFKHPRFISLIPEKLADILKKHHPQTKELFDVQKAFENMNL